MYMITTNVHGCIGGDYYAETFKDLEDATKKLLIVKESDPNAFIVEVKEVKDD